MNDKFDVYLYFAISKKIEEDQLLDELYKKKAALYRISSRYKEHLDTLEKLNNVIEIIEKYGKVQYDKYLLAKPLKKKKESNIKITKKNQKGILKISKAGFSLVLGATAAVTALYIKDHEIDYYYVNKGDTISSIADTYTVDKKDKFFTKVINLDNTKLEAFEINQMPKKSTHVPVIVPRGDTKIDEANKKTRDRLLPPEINGPVNINPLQKEMYYLVKRGDSYDRLIKKFDSTKIEGEVQEGEIISIWTSNEKKEEYKKKIKKEAVGYVSYTVKVGDTIDKLAKGFNLKIEQLQIDNPSSIEGETIFLGLSVDVAVFSKVQLEGELFNLVDIPQSIYNNLEKKEILINQKLPTEKITKR